MTDSTKARSIINLLFARFSWEVYDIYLERKLSKKQAVASEVLLEKYRMYVSAKNVKRELYNDENNLYNLCNDNRDKQILNDLNRVINSIDGLSRIPVEDDGRVREDDILQEFDLERDYYDTRLLYVQDNVKDLHKVDDDKEDIDSGDNILLEEIKFSVDRLGDSMERRFQDIANFMMTLSSSNGQDMEMLGILSNLEKQSTKAVKGIDSLQYSQFRNNGLSSISWRDLPKWGRVQFAQTFWKAACFCAYLPFSLPKYVIGNTIIKPAWHTTQVLFKKLYMIWGLFMIFAVVGTILHITHKNKDIVTMSYPTFVAICEYIFYPFHLVSKYTPSLYDMAIAWDVTFNNIFSRTYLYGANMTVQTRLFFSNAISYLSWLW
jgi:hypothetical protein